MATAKKLAGSMPLTIAFHERTGSIYHSMTARFKQKVNKKGRVIRPGRIVPFTLSEFRLWLLNILGEPDGSTQCAYCRTPLFADTLRIDHLDPVSRGGGLGFTNLTVACDVCNRTKGELTAAEFLKLREVLDVMLQSGALSIAGYNDVWKRLRGAVAIFRRFQAQKPKKSESGLLEEKPEQNRLFTKRLQTDATLLP